MYSFISDYEWCKIRAIRVNGKYQKSMYPPKVVKSPRFGKLREIRRPFFDLDHEKWKPQNLPANCTKFIQFANQHSESRKIGAFYANF